MRYLLTNAFWYMNVSLDKSPDCMRLYTLLFQLLPALLLHDTRHLAGEDGMQCETNRSTMMDRLKLAESGSFIPVIEKFLNATQHSDPKAPGSSLWETQCAKAAKSSISAGWRLAF